MFPVQIKHELDKDILGQEAAKKVLSVIGYNFDQSLNDQPSFRNKNCMLIGPTGVGKTALVNSLAKLLNCPFLYVPSDLFSPRGWVGADIDTLVELLYKANPEASVQELERSIIFIDEIDKIQERGSNRDDYYKLIQGNWLPVLEGTKLTSTIGRTEVSLDTHKMTFIGAGAFSNILRSPTENKEIGFLSLDAKQKLKQMPEHLLREKLVTTGFLDEFVGRFGSIVRLESLNSDQYKDILWLGRDSIMDEYLDFFYNVHVRLELTKSAQEEIADRAIKIDQGVRGLRSVLHEVLLPYMYDLDMYFGKTITITRKSIKAGFKGE